MTDPRVSLDSKISISPEVFVVLPPSPVSSESLSRSLRSSPRVAAAIQLLRERRDCILKDSWNSISLLPEEYNKLWNQLASEETDLLNYVERKVQYVMTSLPKTS